MTLRLWSLALKALDVGRRLSRSRICLPRPSVAVVHFSARALTRWQSSARLPRLFWGGHGLLCHGAAAAIVNASGSAAPPARGYLTRNKRAADIPSLVSACTLQSRRPYQEDRYLISYLTPECSLFGCFDGHGGEDAAEFAREHFPVVFKHELASASTAKDALRATFVKVDEEYITGGGTAGTTAVIAALQDGLLTIAHVGDSRAILCHEGKLVALTEDHKPKVPSEEARIVECGGTVTLDSDGTSRVNARLAMSRSIGDPSLKESGVIAVPDITVREINEKDCFIVLMTDGVSDVLNSAQVCAVVNSCEDAEEAAQELVSLAAQLGSVDNITALVIRLPGWGKFENPEDTHLRHQAYTYNRGGRFRPLSML